MPDLLKQLGETLKQKRLMLQPGDVGLPQVSGRRQGLSQQEVAVLSGVATRWLSRLEQGIFKITDAAALRRVLQTLCFEEQEQEVLLRQAGWRPESWQDVPERQLIPYLQKMLDGLEYPAYVVDSLWERVCWNKSAARLFTHWLGKQVQYTNFIDYLLLDPHSRLFIQNWEKYTALWVGHFLDNIKPFQNNEQVAAFVAARRSQSPMFEKIYRHYAAKRRYKPSLEYVFHTPKGSRRFSRLAFPVADARGWQMIVWLPADNGKQAKHGKSVESGEIGLPSAES